MTSPKATTKGKNTMRKVITMIIEGTKEDINQIKGAIISTASDCIVSLTTNDLDDPQIQPYVFPAIYGKKVEQ